MAVAALVLGILSIVLSWIPYVDFVLAVLAIIFGAVGLSAANKRGGAGKGMAITGLVLGVVTIVLGIIFIAVVYSAVVNTCGVYGC
jgi:thiamine transporter ThiT